MTLKVVELIKLKLARSRWWQLKDFWNFLSENWGKMIQFDAHIFQMGWFQAWIFDVISPMTFWGCVSCRSLPRALLNGLMALEWFPRCGVHPVWVVFAMVKLLTWNRKPRKAKKCWKLKAMTFFSTKVICILIHFWENTCLFCNPICLARHPRRWNLVWSPSLRQVWCFLICFDVDVCCKLFACFLCFLLGVGVFSYSISLE